MTLDEAIEHAEEAAEQNAKRASWFWSKENNPNYENCVEYAKEHRQLAEWLKDYKRLLEQTDVLDKIIAEVKEWYWQADKQALAKDPCVVDAMVDLFIRTIDKYKAESEVNADADSC
ncbi:MAG: hypothetical protein IJE78_05520 [Bacteroidaceae bacterium]|nr:hypothetical protein [Bacteroidaceae bacterium]